MKEFLSILGFTDLTSICWNTLAYIGMILIIVAVISPRLQKHFFVWGPLVLLFYAGLYLHNYILAGLQLTITVSGALNLFNIKKWSPHVVVALAALIYATLLITGQISGLWPIVGSLGLLGIALGLTQLPKKKGFAIMSLGGLLIVVYAFVLQIWVFFVLNIIFFAANILKLLKK